MSDVAPPHGWYVDPSGSAGWRVWNGREWTSVTRPFAPPVSLDLDELRIARRALWGASPLVALGLPLTSVGISESHYLGTWRSPHTPAVALAAGIVFLLIASLLITDARGPRPLIALASWVRQCWREERWSKPQQIGIRWFLIALTYFWVIALEGPVGNVMQRNAIRTGSWLIPSFVAGVWSLATWRHYRRTMDKLPLARL